MSEIQVVRDWYAALQSGDVDSILGAFAPDIEWREAEGHPYEPKGNPWFGVEAIKDKLMARLAEHWERFQVRPLAFYDASPAIVVEGRYSGIFKASGRRLDAQFCHVWHVRDGRLARFQQYTDTGQLQAVSSVPVLQELMSGLV